MEINSMLTKIHAINDTPVDQLSKKGVGKNLDVSKRITKKGMEEAMKTLNNVLAVHVKEIDPKMRDVIAKFRQHMQMAFAAKFSEGDSPFFKNTTTEDMLYDSVPSYRPMVREFSKAKQMLAGSPKGSFITHANENFGYLDLTLKTNDTKESIINVPIQFNEKGEFTYKKMSASTVENLVEQIMKSLEPKWKKGMRWKKAKHS